MTRLCERCGEPIPDGARRTARFCSLNCRKRAHEEEIVGACECGALRTRQALRRSVQCDECRRARERRRLEARDSIVADMWHDGMSRREIAEAFGWTLNYLSTEIARIREDDPARLPYRSDTDRAKANRGTGR